MFKALLAASAMMMMTTAIAHADVNEAAEQNPTIQQCAKVNGKVDQSCQEKLQADAAWGRWGRWHHGRRGGFCFYHPYAWRCR